MADRAFLFALVRELDLLLLPLRRSLETSEDFSELLVRHGWSVPAETLPITTIHSLFGATDFARVEGLLDQASVASEEQRVSLLIEAFGLVQKILISMFDTTVQGDTHPFNSEEFWEKFPASLLNDLIAQYLKFYRPLTFGPLAMLGIVEERAAPVEKRGPSEVHWDRLKDIIRPRVLLEEAYNWGELVSATSPGFLADLFFRHLATLLEAYGYQTHFEVPTSAALDRYYEVSNPHRPNARALVLPLIADIDPGGNVYAVGLSFLPIPAPSKAGPPVGFAISPAIGGTIPALPSDRVGFTFRGGFESNDAIGLEVRPEGVTAFHAGGATTEIDAEVAYLYKPSRPLILIGAEQASRAELEDVRIALRALGTAMSPEVVLCFGTSRLTIVVELADADGILRSILGSDSHSLAFALEIVWSSKTGLHFSGSGGLDLTLPIHRTIGPVRLDSLTVSLRGTETGLRAVASTTGSVMIGPVAVIVEQLGIEAMLEPVPEGRPAGTFGNLNLDFGFKPPGGLGLLIDVAGTITGGGFLRREAGPPERYAGALALRLSRFAVNAFGIFERTPSGLISLVTVLGIRFFPPYPLGFGFSLAGIGGLIGLNRRADIDALRDRLASGTAGNLLFTEDPTRNAPTLLGDLRTLFPAADGIFVVGPTFQIEWLRLARFDVGIVVELPGPTKIVLLGTARLEVGGEAGRTPLVQIRMDIVGVIDFVKELVAFDSVLINSKLLQIFHLTGTAAFRLSSGDRPYVLLTIGGFHPAFNPGPVALPPQKRITLTHDTGGSTRLSLRLEAYLAVTSNTLQVGAALEVGIEAGRIGASGFVSFDALIQFEPFYFITHLSAGFRVRYRSRTLAGVRFSGTLSGPGPLVLSGSFCIELLFFDICWRDSFTLGEDSGQRIQPIGSLVDALRPELARPENLETTGEDREVAVAPERNAPKVLVVPQGKLIWRQKRSPLNILVERLEGIPLSRPQAVVAESQAPAAQDWFSPGTFINLSESEALNRTSFERLDAGIQLDFGITAPEPVTHVIAFETIRLPEENELEVEAVLWPSVLLDAIEGRQVPGRVLEVAPIIGVRDEIWAVRGRNGAVLVDGLTQTDAHQRARAQSATATPSLDARDTINLGGI